MIKEEFEILRDGRKKYSILKSQRKDVTDIAIRNEINKQITEILNLRLKLQQELKMIHSAITSDVLHLFYIAAQSTKTISDSLNISKRHVQRLLRKGEDILIKQRERE